MINHRIYSIECIRRCKGAAENMSENSLDQGRGRSDSSIPGYLGFKHIVVGFIYYCTASSLRCDYDSILEYSVRNQSNKKIFGLLTMWKAAGVDWL